MRLVSKKAHLFLMALVLILAGSAESFAQGKGRGGENRGGGGQQHQQRVERPQVQRQQVQRQPEMRQAQRQPQMQRPQMQRQERPRPEQRQMPQWNRQAQRQPQMQRPQMQRQERPRFEQRQMPQSNRQAQRQPRMERPQMQRQERPRFEQRQMPQWNRQAQRQERPRVEQRQMPQSNRQARTERRGGDRDARPVLSDRMRSQASRSNVIRERTGGNFDGRRADTRAGFQQDRQRPDRNVREQRSSAQALDRWSGRRQDGRESGADRRAGRLSGWIDRRQATTGSLDFGETRSRDSWRGDNDSWRGNDSGFDPNRVDLSGFRDEERAWRRQARLEGRTFDETDFRWNVYSYREREAWRDDVLRSFISVNVGYPNDYYYIPPPSYVSYNDIAYDPWYYNIGYTYYQPQYGGFYFEPYNYVYRPYDYYYSSYFYDDPYYLDDPTDDFLTVRIFASSRGGGVVARLIGGLLGYGYEEGYRDGLLARQTGYVEQYYDDPFVYYEEEAYETVAFYEPYSYSGYENRVCLSEGYQLGYRDALYGNDNYVPEYHGGDLVSLWIGATYQI